MTDDLFQEEEGATSLTHEEKLGLLPSYITQRGELNEVEQINITEGERWAFSRPRDVLEVDFLRELHKRMFGEVRRWAGEYSKERDRRIGSDNYMIPIDLRALMEEVRYWLDHDSYPPDEIALRFHHRLTQIHPFPNGNGRFSRMAADLLITRLGGERFSWGRVNLVDASATRRAYIDTLQAADNYTLEPLLAFARS
ncbi:MAG TPA: mobile mystery protein B [Sphingomicrobium sp.]|nr:mobile mystery protein B [Sphingomicrobium sp.]